MYRLAIVDDEKNIAEGIAQLFPWQDIGFVADYFDNPLIALNEIISGKYDVLLSDIEMPELSGIELCKKLQHLNVIIVFLSSHQNYDYFRSAIQYGVTDYILKPLKSADVYTCFGKIKNLLDSRNSLKDDHPNSYYEQIKVSVENYLSENYRTARLEDAAEKVHLSASYLSSILKEKCNSGFGDMLLKVRMEKACNMLMDVSFKSYDIAYYIGYDNPKSFSRAFKNYYGVTPTEYKNGKR
ncbi:MAG: response regulator [Butyrivibrio sp.]|uniref:response regulator transcription factor n=1 Tax=Butyrivibrio sp. TaxID=28121 RepID=UPI001B0275E0|nr:response regulator [Butyrivibrio sp.]MBO6242382.1 response regulator [Butyrivibrio sp.]